MYVAVEDPMSACLGAEANLKVFLHFYANNCLFVFNRE